jgi:hypothetical protein
MPECLGTTLAQASMPNQARRQLLEERQDVAALQLTADEHVAFRVGAMDLKYRRRDIETDSRDCLYD